MLPDVECSRSSVHQAQRALQLQKLVQKELCQTSASAATSTASRASGAWSMWLAATSREDSPFAGAGPGQQLRPPAVCTRLADRKYSLRAVGVRGMPPASVCWRCM